MDRTVVCINCPVGCRMNVSIAENGEILAVSGNTCPRGSVYARQECVLPERIITAVIPVNGSNIPLSVKTSRPVPKSMIYDIMRELSRIQITLPVSIGQTVLSDVLHTGADIVATRSLE